MLIIFYPCLYFYSYLYRICVQLNEQNCISVTLSCQFSNKKHDSLCYESKLLGRRQHSDSKEKSLGNIISLYERRVMSTEKDYEILLSVLYLVHPSSHVLVVCTTVLLSLLLLYYSNIHFILLFNHNTNFLSSNHPMKFESVNR